MLFLASVCCLLESNELAAQRLAYCPSWNPLALPCPLAEDAVQRLESTLDAQVAGQILARRTIEKALSTNVQRHSNFSKEAWNPYWVSIADSFYSSVSRRGTNKRPLLLHFSGPTGVGKSLTADIIAESILAERNAENQLCGKVLFQMHQYSSRHPKRVTSSTLAIRRMVAEQLHHCPRSVLIFDEIQRAPEELLDNILEIFDNAAGMPLLTFPPYQTPIDTGLCIVIVISDILDQFPCFIVAYFHRFDAKNLTKKNKKKIFVVIHGQKKKRNSYICIWGFVVIHGPMMIRGNSRSSHDDVQHMFVYRMRLVPSGRTLGR